MYKRLYYDPARPSAFSTLRKLATTSGKRPADVQRWLLAQDAYTLHRPLRKRFPRNHYTVSNIMDAFECDLMDVRGLQRFNDGYKYLLTIIDVFSKYVHIIPLHGKTGIAVSTAFRSIFKEPRYNNKRRPIMLRTDRGKEFMNKTFQGMLKREGIQFQVCRNPDIKCSVVERVQRTIRDKLYKYFSYKNTYRYVEVLDNFVRAYNDTPHTTTGIAPSEVRDTDILAIWRRMNKRWRRIPVAKVKFRVGQFVRISKEKMRFAKGSEQNFSTEVFKIIKVVQRTPRPVYELRDLREHVINGQFYGEELSPVRITSRTTYAVDKILDTRGRGPNLEYLIRWKGYSPQFDSWVPATSVKKI